MRFESYRALFEWLRDEANERGYGTLFLADGAEVLWKPKKEFFPEAKECLDWFHVVEKLLDAGKAICRGTRRERTERGAWVAKARCAASWAFASTGRAGVGGATALRPYANS